MMVGIVQALKVGSAVASNALDSTSLS